MGGPSRGALQGRRGGLTPAQRARAGGATRAQATRIGRGQTAGAPAGFR